MSEESTTPDLLELWQRANEAAMGRDFDAMMRLFAADAVWAAPAGVGRFEGAGAIRRLHEDWLGAFGEFTTDVEEAHEYGSGVTFVVCLMNGGLPGSTGSVHNPPLCRAIRLAGDHRWPDRAISRPYRQAPPPSFIGPTRLGRIGCLDD